MVFVNESWNDTNDIVIYSNYHKYWLDKVHGIKNPLFDVFSGKILDLKEGKIGAIKYFYNLLDPEICDDVTICVVPSSNEYRKNTGMTMLGEMLAKNGRRVNKVYYLQREHSIDKLATGGNRNKEVHMNSIIKRCKQSGDVCTWKGDIKYEWDRDVFADGCKVSSKAKYVIL